MASYIPQFSMFFFFFFPTMWDSNRSHNSYRVDGFQEVGNRNRHSTTSADSIIRVVTWPPQIQDGGEIFSSSLWGGGGG